MGYGEKETVAFSEACHFASADLVLRFIGINWDWSVTLLRHWSWHISFHPKARH